MNPLHNISRIDTYNTHGWYVRVQHDGTMHSKMFSDNKHKSRYDALLKAIKHRDMLCNKYKDRPSTKPKNYDKRFLYQTAYNKSTGVVGVYRSFRLNRSGTRYPYYQTTIYVDKERPIGRARSILKHGEEEAFLQICAIRKRYMKEIYEDRFDEAKFDRSVKRHLETIQQQDDE